MIYIGENFYFLFFFFSGFNGFVFGFISKFLLEVMMMLYRFLLNWLIIWYLKNMDRCYSNFLFNVIIKVKKIIGLKVFNRFFSNYIIWNVLIILKKMFVWFFIIFCLNFEEVGGERIFLLSFVKN